MKGIIFTCTFAPMLLLLMIIAKRMDRKENFMILFVKALLINDILYWVKTYTITTWCLQMDLDRISIFMFLDYVAGVGEFFASILSYFIDFVGVGLWEESLKLILAFCISNGFKKVKNKYDLIWYFIVSSVAFSTQETFEYCAYTSNNWIPLCVFRLIVGTACHIGFCLITHHFVDKARKSTNVLKKIKWYVVGIVLAGMAHCLRNSMTTIGPIILDVGIDVLWCIPFLIASKIIDCAITIISWNRILEIFKQTKSYNIKYRRLYLKPSSFEVGGSYFVS